VYGYCETEEAFHGWLRSELRRVWVKHPAKLEVIKKLRYKKLKGKRQVFHIDCSDCKNPFPLKEIEINHSIAVGAFTRDNFGEFVQRLLYVREDELDAVCKPCHSITTYSERYGVSKQESAVQKKAIVFSKRKADKQKSFLEKVGIEPAKSALDRREQYATYARRKLCQ